MVDGRRGSEAVRLSELVVSRLCHDLVGPVGAVNNGLELIAEEEPDMVSDALALAARSAGQAAALLQFYRIAFGANSGGAIINQPALRALAEGYLEHGRAKLEWGEAQATEASGLTGKLVLQLVALAAECLPRGGTIGVSASENGDGVAINVLATGRDAHFREESGRALEGSLGIGEISPRGVVGFLIRRILTASRGEISAEKLDDERVRVTVHLPAKS